MELRPAAKGSDAERVPPHTGPALGPQPGAAADAVVEIYWYHTGMDRFSD